MDLYSELLEVCKKHNTTLANAYWKIAVDDYISCCSDYENQNISDEVTDNVVENILNDDDVWGHIDDAIYYFLGKELNKS